MRIGTGSYIDSRSGGVSALACAAEKGERVGQARRIRAEHGLVGQRRKSRRLALAQRKTGKRVGILALEALEQRVVGKFGLDEHFAGQRGAPGAPADLHQLLEEALGRAEIGGVERRVGADHADQRQARKVVPLGHHLRADENVRVAAVYPGKQRHPLPSRTRHIAIDTQHAGLRKARADPLFEFLRAAPKRVQVLVAAVRAGLRNAAVESAMVAAQPAILEMHNAIGGAMRAAR